MADTFTPVYGWTKPEVGASATTWGGKLNDDLDDIDFELDAVSDLVALRLPLAGGTLSGFLTLHADPDADMKAATKQYADLKAPIASPTFTGTASFARARTPSVAVAISAGVLTIDCALSNVFTVAMNQNITSIVMNNVSDGHSAVIRFKQDATGSRTWTLPATFYFAAGLNPVLSTPANTVDEMSMTYYSDIAAWTCALSKALS
jgi:hypothetical protein